MELSIQRPAFVGRDWLKNKMGFRFASPPPPELAEERFLSSQNLWERVVCVTLQAMSGDFRHVSRLLETAELTKDSYVGSAAVRVFCHAAPTRELPGLVRLFEHPDYDVRVESYTGCFFTSSLSLVKPLLAAFPSRERDERDYVATALGDLLDPAKGEEDALVEKSDSTEEFLAAAGKLAQALTEKWDPQTAILRGSVLSMTGLVELIGEYCRREDRVSQSGEIGDLLAIFEASTGIVCEGCFGAGLGPVFPQITSRLNQFMTSGRTEQWKPGRRTFFGHPVDGPW